MKIGKPFTVAITALEQQRVAYHRYARMVETQRAQLAKGPAEELLGLARRAGEEFQQLEDGARALGPKLAAVRDSSHLDALQARELERVIAEVQKEALAAQRQIQQLTEEMQRWRDEFGRELTSQGIDHPGQAAGPSYGGARGERSYLLDRRG